MLKSSLIIFSLIFLTSFINCSKINNFKANNQPLEECDQNDSSDICIIDDRFVDTPSWEIERNRKIKTLKITNLQSENLPVNVGESFPNLISYSASETSFRILKRENLRHLRMLELLSFKNGQLIRIRRDAFEDVPNLQRLELDYNLIKVISPENFREMQKLEFMSLSNNEIEEVSPRMFRNLLNLKEINISNNKIASITGETFKSNRRLRNIYIKNNNLMFVDSTTFNGLKELKVLSLNGNNCVDKEYKATGKSGGFLAVIGTDMQEFCQIGVKDVEE